jgi:protein TonB
MILKLMTLIQEILKIKKELKTQGIVDDPETPEIPGNFTAALDAYKHQIRQKLVRSTKYPPSAMNNNIQGVATVTFILNRQGQVVGGARLVESSGSPILDDEAQALIQRAKPLPAFPKELELDTLELSVPIMFTLR